MESFTHLHVASSYSLRYGTATPAALAARAAELGMPALALTDRDGLHGAFKHAQACADAGIKPLLGADLALTGPGPQNREPGPQNRGPAPRNRDPRNRGRGPGNRVTLLAAGRVGWASLCRVVSAAHASGARAPGDGPRGGPAVTPGQIAEHAEGLIVLLGPGSDVGRAIAARRPDLAREALRRWHAYCEVAVEVVDHPEPGGTTAPEPGSTVCAARMAGLAGDEHVPAVLTNAVRYLDPADSLVARVLDAARNLAPLGSPRLAPHSGQAWLAPAEDMAAIAGRVTACATGAGAGAVHPTALSARRLLGETAELASRCVLDPAADLGIGRRHLPQTGGKPGRAQARLRARCTAALQTGTLQEAPKRKRRERRDRLARELDIIAQTGMAPYFLTVADIAGRIKSRGIRCAIRGSGAGSFVNYLLGISAIDPLEHGLLMERFLSPVRATLPDIDLDVESARRLEAYRIIFDAYGDERTAAVAVMETYRARSAIRDTAAALSLPPAEIDAIATVFPRIRAKDIATALAELPELTDGNMSAARLDRLFRIAQRLDGLPRHVAMHPCGILLSDATLLDRTAVQPGKEGFPLSHLDKDDAEIAGVIKLDVLGVRMQSAMAHALTEIERTGNEGIDLDAIPRDDRATYDMIGAADTIGCFQIESPGQRELVRKLAPRDVADLIADISLFRPGPVSSDMITPFLRVRHGLDKPNYPHKNLEGALEETGGVVIFHEQVLRIIDAMTDCGLAEADLVRRALSAPGGPERTAVWFRAQAARKGYDAQTVERVWEVIAAFGAFGFCKAHAAAFAIPVYQSAWLKRHHPAAFYAGVLTHDPGMYPKRVIIGDARRAGVEVLPVDVNASAGGWQALSRTDSPDSPAIRVSLREVKGISDAEVASIIAGRPYASLRDFTERASVSRPVTENLILVGALDPLYPLPALPSAPALSPALVSSPVPISSPAPPSAPAPPPAAVPAPNGVAAASAPFRSEAAVSRNGVAAASAPLRNGVAAAPTAEEGGRCYTHRLPAEAEAAEERPTRRDLLARAGVLGKKRPLGRGRVLERGRRAPQLPTLLAVGEGDGLGEVVPAGQLRDLDLAERVAAELGILGFETSAHILDFYRELLDGLRVVRSPDLGKCRAGEPVLVAGVKVAAQTPPVRSGQRVIFVTLDDAAGLVDLAFFESAQGRGNAARLLRSQLLLVRGRVRLAGEGPVVAPANPAVAPANPALASANPVLTLANSAAVPETPVAVSVNATACWDLPALEEARRAGGMGAVRRRLG